MFDKLVQKSKRSYWYKIQTDILNEAKHDDTEFWKRIGKVGISGIRKIPLEVVSDDGSISYLQKDVLENGKTPLVVYMIQQNVTPNVYLMKPTKIMFQNRFLMT